MPIHRQSIAQRIDWLIDLSREHAREFCSPEAYLARDRYLSEHTTFIIVLKCMDGRIHLPYATKTPLGIIRPVRNLGGMFDLGWPYLGEVLHNAIHGAVRSGRRVLVLITYHYSKGDKHRGCAGHNYDTEAAIRYTYAIKDQVEEVFGLAHQTVYPIVCGFETDDEALILHGTNGDRLDLGESDVPMEKVLAQRLQNLYPDMPERISLDLLPLILGNAQHVSELRGRTDRELNLEHREWIICVGRGFDFLHVPNVALIIGPYSPELSDPIKKAATIIHSNMESGRIPDDGFLLLASAPYEEFGVDRARATLKSRFLSDFAAEVIRREVPDLYPRMIKKTAILNWQTRSLEEFGG
jgi:hypothetical protein